MRQQTDGSCKLLDILDMVTQHSNWVSPSNASRCLPYETTLLSGARTFLHGESGGEVEVVGAHALLDPLGQLGALVVAVIPETQHKERAR